MLELIDKLFGWLTGGAGALVITVFGVLALGGYLLKKLHSRSRQSLPAGTKVREVSRSDPGLARACTMKKCNRVGRTGLPVAQIDTGPANGCLRPRATGV